MSKRGRKYPPSPDLAGACGSKPPASSRVGRIRRLHLVPHDREREIGFFRDEREAAWGRWVVTVTGGMDKERGVGPT
jgi:hypothetical protein